MAAGAELFDNVHDFVRRFVAFPSTDASVAVTLWAAHTHLVEAFEATPRLALLSPEKQCGKSRTLELLELLCAGAETLTHTSPAYLFRRIGAGSVTVLLDEADAIWKRGKSDDTAEALRSVVNAGHRKSGTVGRAGENGKPGELRRFRVFAPVAVAGIGSLPDTILDRAVVVPMRRRAPDENVDEYRERTTRPEGEELRAKLAAWSGAVADRIGDPWPRMPDGVHDRSADVWEPLLAVADLAEGHWPERARAACVGFVTGSWDNAASVGVRLLGDLRDAFAGVDAMSTDTILDRLHKLDEAPWADWYGHPLTARGLAKLLKPYGVASKVVRIGETTPRGYRREDMWDSWGRYLPGGVSATSATSATPLIRHVADVADVADKGPDTTTADRLNLGRLPGRCPGCGWHIETQGHAPRCQQAAA